jgi:hypothetical protein
MNSGKKSKNQNIAYLSFYGILKDILRAKKNLVIKQDQEKKKIVYPLMRRSSIKDIIESLGIPHTEIGLLKNKDVKIDFGSVQFDSKQAVCSLILTKQAVCSLILSRQCAV